MRRKNFDRILSFSGVILTVFLAIAGGLLLWGANFAKATVTDQLTQQNIAFDADPANLPPELADWAGVVVTDGESAKAYSDMIAIHIDAATGGKSYSQVSGDWFAAGKPGPSADQNEPNSYDIRMTAFMGESLRGMLLNAYAFWTIGTIAAIAGWVVLVLALVSLVATILGFRHAGKVEDTATI
jgi:hypothetical protein